MQIPEGSPFQGFNSLEDVRQNISGIRWLHEGDILYGIGEKVDVQTIQQRIGNNFTVTDLGVFKNKEFNPEGKPTFQVTLKGASEGATIQRQNLEAQKKVGGATAATKVRFMKSEETRGLVQLEDLAYFEAFQARFGKMAKITSPEMRKNLAVLLRDNGVKDISEESFRIAFVRCDPVTHMFALKIDFSSDTRRPWLFPLLSAQQLLELLGIQEPGAGEQLTSEEAGKFFDAGGLKTLNDQANALSTKQKLWLFNNLPSGYKLSNEQPTSIPQLKVNSETNDIVADQMLLNIDFSSAKKDMSTQIIKAKGIPLHVIQALIRDAKLQT